MAVGLSEVLVAVTELRKRVRVPDPWLDADVLRLMETKEVDVERLDALMPRVAASSSVSSGNPASATCSDCFFTGHLQRTFRR
jgi:hypothetical protein